MARIPLIAGLVLVLSGVAGCFSRGSDTPLQYWDVYQPRDYGHESFAGDVQEYDVWPVHEVYLYDGNVLNPELPDLGDQFDSGKDVGPGDAPTTEIVVLDVAGDGVVNDAPNSDAVYTDCCVFDYECPYGWSCVHVNGMTGACKPPLEENSCWSSRQCDDDEICFGAVLCPCGYESDGDGCDIPGRCEEKALGCCADISDCVSGYECAPTNTCEPALKSGECWTDGDCWEYQKCEGATMCPCGFECLIGTFRGWCSPLPSACCFDDDDCSDGKVCRGTGASLMPGSCVRSPAQAECGEGETCCWNDGDCNNGWCDGAEVCGCIELCPVCGACLPDEVGHCVDYGIQIDFDPLPTGECAGWLVDDPLTTWYTVSMSWTTSVSARSWAKMALNEFTGNEYAIFTDEEYKTSHFVQLSLAHLAVPVPRVGDILLFKVEAETKGGVKGESDIISIPVDQAVVDCLYPYDEKCSDGGIILCRIPPQKCGKDQVMAAINGCYQCVYPDTCTCDDGTDVLCNMIAPECDGSSILAVQNECWACVDPFTCK